MRTVNDLHGYQQKATTFQSSKPESMLWLDVGLGKTGITLTSMVHLLNSCQVNAVLVVAPIKVCKLVWRQEALKWSHTQHLKFNLILGTKDQRIRALMRPADVYLINYENIHWLASMINTFFLSKGKPMPFTGLVWDEVDKMMNSGTERVKAFRKIVPHFVWKTGLTGTPAGNGYKDLHGQYLVVDEGKRLGTSKTAYMTRWYRKVSDESRKVIAYKDTQEGIKELIGDMTLEMSAADYNPLPDLIVNDMMIELDEPIRKMYDILEKEFFIKFDSGAEVELFNQGSLMNKLLQLSNGAVYPIAGAPMWEQVHDQKLDSLDDIISQSNGQPVLCSYAFRSDAERIMKRFEKLRPINLTECKTEKSLFVAMNRWVTGDCELMIGHPLSMGHGIDGLQQTGHIAVWFGLTWSLRQFIQFNGRLRRQGQGVPVICHRILCKDTFDELQRETINEKDESQAFLRKSIKEYRLHKKYTV